MKPLFVNETGIKTLTIRLAGFNLSVGATNQYQATYIKNGKMATDPITFSLVSGTTYKIYEFDLDFDVLIDISIKNTTAVTTVWAPTLCLYVGTGLGSSFNLIKIISNVFHPLRTSSLNSINNSITFDSKDMAVGYIDSTGGSGMVKTWDFDHTAQVAVTDVFFRIATGGVATGVKAILTAWDGSIQRFLIGCLTFDLPATDPFYGAFSVDAKSQIIDTNSGTTFMTRWNKAFSQYLKLEIVGASVGSTLPSAVAYFTTLTI